MLPVTSILIELQPASDSGDSSLFSPSFFLFLSFRSALLFMIQGAHDAPDTNIL